MDDMLIDGADLRGVLRTFTSTLCKDILREIVELSKTYDVIIDNGKVILSEKS